MNEVANLTDWTELGLAGAVIVALFAVLMVLVKWLIAHIDKQADSHRLERDEWRKSSIDTTTKVDAAVRDLSSSIRELGREKR